MPPERKKEKPEDRNPFVKGSVYRIRSLGTHDAPIETHGTFLGFTSFGMGGEALRIELSKEHGKDKGLTRIIPVHMLLHIDILEQKEPDESKDDEGHPVFYS